MKVPYVDLAAQHAPIKSELLAAVSKVLDHGQFILGDEVSEFERRFAELSGVPYAVGVNSGTDALILALKALGIGAGDEVITVPNSFVASAGCIALLGATPVFVDVGEDYNMDPDLLESAITPKTKAVLPVHLTGRPANMDPIMEVSNRHGLPVIEDAAQAVAAEYKGQRVGSIGTIGCFSLHPLKTLNACGDGGVLTTKDAGLYEDFKILRNIGLRTRDDFSVWSGNSRLDTMQAAILLVKLDHFDQWTESRRENALAYQKLLEGIPQVKSPVDMPYEHSVYHTFVIQAERRDSLKAHLGEHGIGSSIHYPVPIHLQTGASSLGYQKGSFPVTEKQAESILSLPVYPELKQHQLEYVADCVRSFYDTEVR
jgi:dTDP-4-amino-4,6-dideoxygalactose transaminase